MTRIISSIVMLLWALWFGGMIALMIFVIRLFNTSREVGIQTAPILFRSFANYQLAVGLIACMTGTFLSLLTRKRIHAAICLLMILALAAAIVIRSWTYEMEMIRLAGQSGGLRFQTLHNRSSALYAVAAILLFVAGIGWMLNFPPRQKADEIAEA